MRVAICDDEQVQCQLLTKELKVWAKEQSIILEVVPFCDAESFLFQWEDDKEYDLLILDFQIDFEHVSFRYPGSDDYIIKDLTISFVIGEKMAIVGRNGSGKTTFIKLLCRLYDVTEGCIKLNGIDIRKYDYKEYCNLLAVVFQDFKIFSFSLGENVAASEQVEHDRATDALLRAGFGERLQTLPEGLDTYVDKDIAENGVNFSGGEKKKLQLQELFTRTQHL